MKLKELLPRRNAITEGQTETFIADHDFSYSGLPIISGSLVHFDSEEGIVYVNKMPPSAIQEIAQLLGLDFDQFYNITGIPLAETVSDCKLEMKALEGYLIWHKDHFDKNIISETTHPYFLERVKKERTLQCSGFTFSCVSYIFNSNENRFLELISIGPIKLKEKDAIFNLDGIMLLQSSFDSFYIDPLDVVIYHGFPITAPITLYGNGILNAALADPVLVNVINKNNYLLKVSKFQTIDIISFGMARLTIFWDDSDRSELITMKLVESDGKYKIAN